MTEICPEVFKIPMLIFRNSIKSMWDKRKKTLFHIISHYDETSEHQTI